MGVPNDVSSLRLTPAQYVRYWQDAMKDGAAPTAFKKYDTHFYTTTSLGILPASTVATRKSVPSGRQRS